MPWVGEVKSGVVVAITKLHESLQSAGDPQNTRKQNPLRFSLFPYRNVCQAFKVDYGLLSKEEVHNIKNSLQILIYFRREWGTNIFFEAPEYRKGMNGWKLHGE